MVATYFMNPNWDQIHSETGADKLDAFKFQFFTHAWEYFCGVLS